MPSGRPRPFHLNPAPRRKPRSGSRPPKSPRSPRKRSGDSTAIYWIVGLLLISTLIITIWWFELPRIEALFSKEKPVPEQPRHEPVHPPTTPVPAPPKDDRLARLQAQVEKETHRLVERPTQPSPIAPPVAKPTPPAVQPPPPASSLGTPAPASTTTNANAILPPIAQPAAPINPSGTGTITAPPRALPVDPNKLTTERIASYQVALERIHFSCGFIDGDQGMRTQRMLRAYQASRDLPVTGVLDQPTRDSIGEPGEPFLTYTVTADDIASIMPKPATWKEKSKVQRLGYNDMWEMLAEKFHCTRSYLKALNRDIKEFTPGAQIIGPKVFPAAPLPKAASLRILLSETSIEALDANGKVIAFFPCSIAADKNKRPNGVLTVKSIVPDPDYTFDPALFADASAREGITKKMRIPPGPRNPVGTAWIGLSLPGYGIHGTPEPENISRTQSHGCFRLANWNAEKVLKIVKVGTVVDVQP